MVAIDAGFLSLMLHPKAKPPNDPSTNEPTAKAAERVESLFGSLDASHERILIPTPALCEFLVLAGKDGPSYLNDIFTQGTFMLQPFDVRAAVELAAMEIIARGKGSKKRPAKEDSPWQKVKFDRQIVAIAKVHSARIIYSDDGDIKNIAEEVGIRVIPCWELPLPTSNAPLFDFAPDLPPTS